MQHKLAHRFHEPVVKFWAGCGTILFPEFPAA